RCGFDCLLSAGFSSPTNRFSGNGSLACYENRHLSKSPMRAMPGAGKAHPASEPVVKILFVAWYFPPSNTIAAVRLGKLAKFLTRATHDIRVLTPKDVPYAPTLPVEIPHDRIYRT